MNSTSSRFSLGSRGSGTSSQRNLACLDGSKIEIAHREVYNSQSQVFNVYLLHVRIETQ